ncbi:putative 5-formyltetrahydrofolate cyclo-ligase [Caloramator mitchellensis]|uniref:5-formyltetrahydrofolate cyclo-ligase n=1 Tax=Caloramator mitchellensis TaxID=908809 RepID=A0A0R3JX44_CALMK|nr:5-formyltetrahydrofolate cyclo-ligase [Caloramator mitchellensis]KRQ88118.1 putative 5-formyltetrahydrofolate cyclo-ligase [Caloramator mitchellensis]
MKKELRKEIINKRNLLSQEEVRKLSEKVTANIFELIDMSKIESIMLYHPIQNEVSTEILMKYCFENNINVILPKVIKDVREIIPCKIETIKSLRLGEYNIMEPFEYEIADKKEIDVIIVPGVAFSRKGYRLGYGAGYYDKFLSDYKGLKVGLCYTLQLVEDVFEEEHDVKMDYIVCDSEIIAIK